MQSVLVQFPREVHVVMSLLIEKLRNYLVVPEDFVCTSKPQTWHKPHGDKINGKKFSLHQLAVIKHIEL